MPLHACNQKYIECEHKACSEVAKPGDILPKTGRELGCAVVLFRSLRSLGQPVPTVYILGISVFTPSALNLTP